MNKIDLGAVRSIGMMILRTYSKGVLCGSAAFWFGVLYVKLRNADSYASLNKMTVFMEFSLGMASLVAVLHSWKHN